MMPRSKIIPALSWIGILIGSYLGNLSNVSSQEVPLSDIDQLMRTPREEVGQRQSVRVIGIVSAVGEGLAAGGNVPPAERFFCVEQAGVGIWVRSAFAIREGLMSDTSVLADLRCGTIVELEGFLDHGLFAPVILPRRVTILGTEPLPPARRAVLQEFFRGADDVQRVSVDGVVQSVIAESRRWLLRVETGAGHFLVRLPQHDQFAPEKLLDAKIEFTGLAAVSRNWRSEFVCPRLIIDRTEDIKFLKLPPPDPFAAPRLSLDHLDGFHPDGRPLHRLCVEGTLTFRGPNRELYLQDGDCAIRIETNEAVEVEVGERLEVAGFIDTTHHVAGLRGAVIRKASASGTRHPAIVVSLPAPQLMTMEQIEDDFHRILTEGRTRPTSCDGRLIQLRGRLLSIHQTVSTKVYRLEIETGDSVSTALLYDDGSNAERARIPKPGAELLLTGIAALQYPPVTTRANLLQPTRLDVLLRGTDDITLLSQPPWWTVTRVATLLMFVFAVAIIATGWAFTLRRTVQSQTRVIAEQMRQRRDAVIEFQAAISERTRLAANLHDTLLQTVTGIGFQIAACVQASEWPKEKLDQHLTTAGRMVEHCQDDLRNVVWTLHSMPVEFGSLADSVRELVRRLAERFHVEVIVFCDNQLPRLADFVAGNILLVIQEAIQNSIKHADAKKIHVNVSTNEQHDHIELKIRDDGIGFDFENRLASKQGHFGIEVMQQRIQRLSGTFDVESSVGNGTTIVADIPIREFDTQLC